MSAHHSPSKVLVIGGGIAGTAITRLLGLGLPAGPLGSAHHPIQVTLLEKSSRLCSGATWHAAGLVTRFGGSSKIKKIHVRSLDLLTALQEKVDKEEDMHESLGLHLPGSIRIIIFWSTVGYTRG